jgi:hypothetical protein
MHPASLRAFPRHPKILLRNAATNDRPLFTFVNPECPLLPLYFDFFLLLFFRPAKSRKFGVALLLS